MPNSSPNVTAANLPGDADQFIKYIVEGSERMENLIHDLLDFSRVDARGTDFFTRVNCDDALNDAIGNLHSLIEESGAVLTRGQPCPGSREIRFS